jgi:hypothetical protein
MSRHIIPSRSPEHVVVVGLDESLGRYFLYVFNKAAFGTEAEDDGNVDLHSVSPQELPEVDHLAEAATPYAELAPATRRRLYLDREIRRMR